MTVTEKIINKAKASQKTIVLPEGSEPRTLIATAKVLADSIARPVLLGDPVLIEKTAADLGADIKGARVIDPVDKESAGYYAESLFRFRESKGLSREEAAKLILDPMYYAVMMVKCGDADGMVSGAVHTTGQMLRPALQIIKTKPGINCVSSSFIMELPDKTYGEDGVLIYADCVVIPDPTDEELAHIAVTTADTARTLCDFKEPRVAMLSFSTMGSAQHESADKVRRAVQIARRLSPQLCLDGEMQFDAAIVPEIGALKAPGSSVAGRANILIFPDLQSGNIGYKITQRLGKADAFAVLQGLARPCNDLSRGCSSDDIVKTIAITAVQAG